MKDYGDFATFHSDVFLEYFKPYRPSVIDGTELFGDFELQPSAAVFSALKSIDQRFVWTILEDGYSRNLYFSPGLHIVNRVGYAVTDKAHNFASVEFCAYWRRFLSETGVRRESVKLQNFLDRALPKPPMVS